MRRLVFVFALAAISQAQTPESPEKALTGWMNQTAQRQLSEREAKVRAIRNVTDARARQAAVRAKILDLLGGLPDYEGPLNARVTGSIRQSGYTIDKVIFDSLPGYHVTANLYLPGTAGKHPAVLYAIGHWEEGKPNGQQIAGNLALKGFVVLTFDPVGQGERVQAFNPLVQTSLLGGSTEQHTTLGAQSIWLGQSFARYRIRDAKRALDYLVSRPEVDADRIGAIGCSGGGTVTTYISALDPRVKVAAPACYINTFREVFPGPTGDAEQSVPGFLEAGLDIADYIELFAPKPWLIGSTREDFFPVAGAQQAFEEAQRWYGWFGADDRIKWAVGPGGHGTPVEVREAIYGWMQRWLGNPSADAHDVPVNLLPDWQLWATESGQVDGRQLYEYLRDEYKRLHRPLGREALAAEIRRIATGPVAVGTDFVPVPKFDFSAGGDQILIRAGDRVLLFKSVVPRAFTGNWILALRALLIGETLPGIRIRSIRAAIDSLGADKVEIAARGMPAVWAAAAALIDPRITRLSLDRMPVSVASAFETPVLRNPLDALLFLGFALHWDLADLLDSRAVLSDPVDWTGTIVPRRAGVRYHATSEIETILF